MALPSECMQEEMVIIGSDFEKVGTLMQLSSILIVFMCIGNFVGVQFLGPTGLQNKMTKAYIVAALTNVLLNIIMIPKFCSVGAMIASIIAEFLSCFIQILYLNRSEYRISLFFSVWKYICAGAIMGILILVIHTIFGLSGFYSTFVDIIVGTIVYFACLLCFGEENVVLLKEKIATRKK